MDFALAPEQQALQREVRKMLQANCPSSHVRARRGQRDLDEKFWQSLVDMGLLSTDLSILELALIAEETGRVLAPVPWIATRVAQAALAEVGKDVPEGSPLALCVEGEEFSLDAHVARSWVVACPGRLCITQRLETEPCETLDFGRFLARFRVDACTPVGPDNPAVDRARDLGALLIAAELVGTLSRALEIALDYAKQRKQFDRPIGSFQAIQHRLVDIWRHAESLRSLTLAAAWALGERQPDASRRISMAKAYAAWHVPAAISSAIQTLGGIGFTWEHDMHLYFRRALVSAPLFGSASWHRDRILATPS